MSLLNTHTPILCATLALAATLYYARAQRWKLPLPPGPRKLPLVGNSFDLPVTSPWEVYTRWSKQYGSDILHLDLAGTSVIILSSLEATDALLERRSAIYSDRQVLGMELYYWDVHSFRGDFPMVVDLMGWDFNIALMKYGEDWRTTRRLFNHAFNVTASQQYRPQLQKAARLLLERLLDSPEEFLPHFRQMSGEIIMSVTYGIDVLPTEDPYITAAEEAMHSLAVAAVPGQYLVDVFPILKHVPRWLPGAGFKRLAEGWRKLARATMDLPFAETKRQMESGVAPRSFTADGLSALKNSDIYYKEHHLRATAATMFAAASDTTASALGSFALAMLANPEAQRRAQAEIDSVTGGKYLPTLDDQSSMPYLAALIKEVLRWENVTPIALPHRLTRDDEYRGYRLPAGSLVIGNAWAILHDETTYPDPFTFKPERFLLDDAARDPDTAFGFGRRRCPGRHMAALSLWITIASILATFNIEKAVDDAGHIIEPRHEYVSGLVSTPLPFQCTIIPRSEGAVALIRAAMNTDPLSE
ncbi:cytochrome P450 [Mycena rosella]|uniref:Cytochrome P450 n=1 Tax=Mycena rosella TaxID=1033263 RepID=A0AAD7GGS6_MYCRO|nr:cytochrome P450 [Mycena rosella]